MDSEQGENTRCPLLVMWLWEVIELMSQFLQNVIEIPTHTDVVRITWDDVCLKTYHRARGWA